MNEGLAHVQVFEGAGKPMRAAEWELPQDLGESEVLVKLQMATICGSDLHTVEGKRQEPTPAVLGHEGVGLVLRTGKGRAGLEPGDMVTWCVADTCGTCPPCTTFKLPQKCDALFKYGHTSVSDGSGLNGCYASHILLRRGTHIVRVPPSLPVGVVAPANCALATMVNAVDRLPEDCVSVVVQGGGLLGLYGCALLRERGVTHIFCVEVSPARLALIPRFGGIPIDGRPERYPADREQIVQAAPRGVDAVIEVAGVSALVPEGVSLLRPGGCYGFVGMVHPDTHLRLTGEAIIRKCLCLWGVHNYAPRHLDDAVAFLERCHTRFPFAELVAPPIPLSQLEDGLRLAATRQWCRVSLMFE